MLILTNRGGAIANPGEGHHRTEKMTPRHLVTTAGSVVRIWHAA
jgi:hypothetical protein